MIKKVILAVMVIVNIFLVIVLVMTLPRAAGELRFEYVEEETITPDTLRMYIERENYGTVASLSRPIRAGAKLSETDIDYYRIGEYAELLFLKEVFERTQNADTARKFEDEILSIRSKMPAYNAVFDRIDQSAADAAGK